MTRIRIKATAEDRVMNAAKRRGLRADMGPEDIDGWIDAITDIESAKTALKILALEVVAVKSWARRRDRHQRP